jgi:hypothetical protein
LGGLAGMLSTAYLTGSSPGSADIYDVALRKLAEEDGFEPEIPLAVLPRTQSETSVQLSAVNTARLPTHGLYGVCLSSHHAS